MRWATEMPRFMKGRLRMRICSMPWAQRARWPNEGDEGLRLQAGNSAACRHRPSASPKACSASAVSQSSVMVWPAKPPVVASALRRRTAAEAAEEGGVPLVEPALQDRIEHLVFRRHPRERVEVLFERIGIEEEVRRLDEEELLVLAKKPTVSLRKSRTGA